MKTLLNDNGKLSVWSDADEKPYVCIDADGEHLNLPTGILYGTRIGSTSKVRKWFDNLPVRVQGVIGLIGCSFIALFLIGYVFYCGHAMQEESAWREKHFTAEDWQQYRDELERGEAEDYWEAQQEYDL
jgi:hypothetical protein